MTRGERVIAFIESYCVVPEGKLIGQKIKLCPFQRRFILAVYDTGMSVRARRAILSIGRKNGKTALIACICLAHLVGPEAVQNSQIISGAMSRDQAALVFNFAKKMIELNEDLKSIIRIVDSGKKMIGLPMNVEYKAIAAEAGTSHGLSPVLAILDELGQIKGPSSPFVEAVETSQGAYDEPLLVAISTQAPTDDDLFSRWIDDAKEADDPLIVCHLYSADEDADLLDERAWEAANPGIDIFRSREDIKMKAHQAERLPSEESSFRWLFLNQRVETHDPYVSPSVWADCSGDPSAEGVTEWFGGLDLASSGDLCAYVRCGYGSDGNLQVMPTFWLPTEGLRERSRNDRVEYSLWAKEGYITTTPGNTVDYDWIAPFLLSEFRERGVHSIAFDRWNFRFLRASLVRAGAREDEIERFVEFGQGFQSISPALRILDTLMLNSRLRHGSNPVLSMCAKNSVVKSDPAGNRKLVKLTPKRRIDGMVALAMAAALAGDPPDLDANGSYIVDEGEVMFL